MDVVVKLNWRLFCRSSIRWLFWRWLCSKSSTCLLWVKWPNVHDEWVLCRPLLFEWQ
jgi:hypothetical protein